MRKAERQWRIEVGYGLEGVLPDAMVGTIGREILTPNVTAGTYYDGIYGETLAVGQEIVDNYHGPGGGDPQLWDWRGVAGGGAGGLLVGLPPRGGGVPPGG